MNWNAVNGIVAVLGLILAIVGLLASIVAGRAAKGAQSAADDARSDAVAALKKSADAEQRIATAIEILAGRGNGSVGTAKTPSPRTASAIPTALSELIVPQAVRWSAERRAVAGTVRLRNIGSIGATAITVTGNGDALPVVAPRTLAPGAAAVFGPSDRPLAELTVTWIDSTSTEQQSAEVRVA